MSFSVEKWDEDDRLLVKQDGTGWFFPVESEIQASELCKKLNELETVERPLDLHKDFERYDELIDEINTCARELFKQEETYQLESDRILKEAKENNVDFKKLYGGNNVATRKQYVDEQLDELVADIQELKFKRDENAREIGFIKRLIDMKTAIIKYGDGE